VLSRAGAALHRKRHRVERIPIDELDISGCIVCHACSEPEDEPGRAIDDAVPGIFKRIIPADATVFSRLADYLKTDLRGTFVSPNCTSRPACRTRRAPRRAGAAPGRV